jgi:hypothetical protein
MPRPRPGLQEMKTIPEELFHRAQVCGLFPVAQKLPSCVPNTSLPFVAIWLKHASMLAC